MSLTEQEAQKLDDTLNYAQRTALAAEQFIDELRNNGGNASLSDAVDSNRSDVGASSAAVKAAYDRAVAAGFIIGQYYWFEDEMPRPGFFRLLGGTVPNFAATYPEAAAYFRTTYGAARLVASQAEYDALHTAVYYTNADGETEGWNGIGGVNKFFWDTLNDTLTLPDLAGMSPEQIGCDGLGVGDVREDRRARLPPRLRLAAVRLSGATGLMTRADRDRRRRDCPRRAGTCGGRSGRRGMDRN